MPDRDILIDFCGWLEAEQGVAFGSWEKVVDWFLAEYDPADGVLNTPGIASTTVRQEPLTVDDFLEAIDAVLRGRWGC